MRFTNCLGCIKKLTVILLAVGLLVSGCGPRPSEGLGGQNILEKGHNFAPQEGDLLFQDLDCGPVCDAIEKVTTGFGGANFSHVGIVAKDDTNNFVVIEAVSNGVQATALQTFLDRSSDEKGRPKVVVGRLKPAFHHLIPLALKEAFALKGKPYDELFVIDNEVYYCSELIYEIFSRANDNNPIFTLQPMTFKDPNTGVTFPTWQEYFSQLGAPIPEGKQGINPGSISCSPVLTIIHAYGIPNGWEKREPNGNNNAAL